MTTIFVSPSIRNFNALFQHLICPITGDVAYQPVECSCGHLFDSPAITQWLNNHQHCPVSRQHLTVAMLKRSLLVEAMLASLNLNRHDTCTITGVNSVAVQTSSQPVMLAPYTCLSNDLISVSDLTPEQLNFHDGGRLLNVDDGLINPNSDNLDDIKDTIIRRNRSVLNTYNTPCDYLYRYLTLHKYTYQHKTMDPQVVATYLSNQGYFVYDTFRVGRNNGLSNFVVYSIHYRAHGVVNQLPRYRVIRH